MAEEDFTILEQVPAVVHINVGGQLFLTSRTTLHKVPDSLIAGMFRGDVPVNKVKQTDSVYFVDRDPKHFQRVLNFMRDGACVIPGGREGQLELLAEASYYRLTELQQQIEVQLRDHAPPARVMDLRTMVLQHHAQTGNLEGCLETVLTFVRDVLVGITPVTDVDDENRLCMFWLSASMPPSSPARLVFRYRGDKDSNDVGVCVDSTDSQHFDHWSRLWDIYHNKQLLTAFKALASRRGLKVTFNNRMETFKQDSQLDVVWKMYRVRSLALTIAPEEGPIKL